MLTTQKVIKESISPLVVDLDGSLLQTDLLYECIASTMRSKPWLLFYVPFWLCRGKAYLKRRLSQAVELDFESLPINQSLIKWLTLEKAKGRTLSLVSASDHALVAKVGERFQFFDYIQGSNGITNLAGLNKLSELIKRFGHNFTYVGNSNDDLVIWKSCRAAVLVGPISYLKKSLLDNINVEAEFSVQSVGFRTWVRALRLYQWSKNTLIFLPFFLAGPIAYSHKIVPIIFGFFCFSLLASGNYLVNDLLDLPTDRKHRSKCQRPLASGELPILHALLSLPIIFGVLIFFCFFLPVKFITVALMYLIVTQLYSFFLKRKPVLDLVILAGLFSLRILAGMILLEVPSSPWLLTFSMFFFFSLAAIKRYSECLLMKSEQSNTLPGRGYQPEDYSFLMPIGITSGFCSSLVFFVYVMESTTSILANYNHPKFLWVVCIILNYWIGRAWFIAFRKEMHDDPIIFAFKDRVSLIMGFVVTLLIVGAHGYFF